MTIAVIVIVVASCFIAFNAQIGRFAWRHFAEFRIQFVSERAWRYWSILIGLILLGLAMSAILEK